MPENSREPQRTSLRERRIISAAALGDQGAQLQLLARYEGVVRAIARDRFVRGADREDLEQILRLAIVDAIRRWDASRGASFAGLVWLCASRASASAIETGRARKHEVLTCSRRFSADGDADDPDAEQPAICASRDDDPVAKTLAREELRHVIARAATLSQLERQALSLSANDRSHREIADTLHVPTRSVNNALQRARRKLAGTAFA